MRSVKNIKAKRNFLRDIKMKTIEKQRELVLGRTYSDLDKYEKNLYGEMIEWLRKLDAQINALEFVLNEDTEMLGLWKESMRNVTAGEVMCGENWFEDEPSYED